MPFKEFCAVFRAKSLSEPKLDPTNIKAVQIMLSKFEYDGMLNPNFTEGPFKLEIDSISTASDAPRLVHISSAGVTRVLRKVSSARRNSSSVIAPDNTLDPEDEGGRENEQHPTQHKKQRI